jgi:glycosyltransferase involved in cell wall biosynthesis
VSARDPLMECITPTSYPRLYRAQEKNAVRRRPKLLFLAHRFPPANTSACVRTRNVAKYLARLGWDVTVVTPHPSVWRLVNSPQEIEVTLKREGIRRILTGHRWRCLAPDVMNCWNQSIGRLAGGLCRIIARRLGVDPGIGWIKSAEQACAALTAEDVDIILATGPPFAPFTLARRLSKRLSRPYILDYRDPWTAAPHGLRSSYLAPLQKEARLLADSAAVTIVSPSWGLALNHRYGIGSKVHVLTNGYDLEELEEVRPYNFGHAAIVYTGNFYPPKRVITPLMAALQRLKETVAGECDWFFHCYGGQANHVLTESERFGVRSRVVLHGQVPRAEALAAVQGAKVAVVITSIAEEVTMADKGIIPAKVFEALGLGTPVLLIAPPDGDITTLVETTGLAQSFSGNDIEGMASFLSEAMSGCPPKPKHPEAYAWTNIAKTLDAILRGVAARAYCNETGQPLEQG